MAEPGEGGDLYAWEPVGPSAVGTTCAECWARGITTLHSPAGEQHRAWEDRWAADPSWWPEGAPTPMPSFADVAKAFTPPGTDFDEFKRSLHSQGAPGRVSPELVAMLNKAAAADAIPGGMMAQSGTPCARCDHPHGGPPGKTCLEAEAHLGRSPLRRRPDLQLDAIAGPRQQASAYQDTDAAMHAAARADFIPDFPPGMPSVGAVAAHEQYLDFRRAGFTESQALTLIRGLIAEARPDNTDT